MVFDTVLGYTFNGDVYCPDCAEGRPDIDTSEDGENVGVVFACHEWDYAPSCGACGEEIEGVVILEHEE